MGAPVRLLARRNFKLFYEKNRIFHNFITKRVVFSPFFKGLWPLMYAPHGRFILF